MTYYIVLYGETQQIVYDFIKSCTTYHEDEIKKDKKIYSYEYVVKKNRILD